MIKPDHWIRGWGEGGGAEPYAPEQVNSASYDVRVSDEWICPTRDPESFKADSVKLFPGEVVLACTLECDGVRVTQSDVIWPECQRPLQQRQRLFGGSAPHQLRLAHEQEGVGGVGGRAT